MQLDKVLWNQPKFFLALAPSSVVRCLAGLAGPARQIQDPPVDGVPVLLRKQQLTVLLQQDCHRERHGLVDLK